MAAAGTAWHLTLGTAWYLKLAGRRIAEGAEGLARLPDLTEPCKSWLARARWTSTRAASKDLRARVDAEETAVAFRCDIQRVVVLVPIGLV